MGCFIYKLPRAGFGHDKFDDYFSIIPYRADDNIKSNEKTTYLKSITISDIDAFEVDNDKRNIIKAILSCMADQERPLVSARLSFSI